MVRKRDYREETEKVQKNLRQYIADYPDNKVWQNLADHIANNGAVIIGPSNVKTDKPWSIGVAVQTDWGTYAGAYKYKPETEDYVFATYIGPEVERIVKVLMRILYQLCRARHKHGLKTV